MIEEFTKRIEKLSPEKRALLAEQLRDIPVDLPEAQAAAAQKSQQLVAWIVAEDGKNPPAETLQQFLAAQLPDYMVPVTITTLDTLPQTPNGKVDRKALAENAAEQPASREYLAPRNALETVLQSLWTETLNRESIGINDHFFQLGGHSLLVTVLVAQIRDMFEMELSLRSIFEAPTIAELAQYMRDNSKDMDMDEAAELILKLAEMSDEDVAAMLDDVNG